MPLDVNALLAESPTLPGYSICAMGYKTIQLIQSGLKPLLLKHINKKFHKNVGISRMISIV